MIPTNDERFILEVYKRKANSKYEWEDASSSSFRGRIASDIEKKNYRIQKGVNGNTDSTFIYCSNMPKTIDVGDKVKFMGKIWSVQSIGYYYNASRIINPNVMSDQQIIARCPKGINLQ